MRGEVPQLEGELAPRGQNAAFGCIRFVNG
jgi:hypothetical protein